MIVVKDAPEEKDLASKILEYIDSLSDKRIRYIEHEKNKGANAARNTGLYYASGDYIGFLDDDDEWNVKKLETQVSYMKSGVALVYGPFIVRKDTGDSCHSSERVLDPLKTILEGNFIGTTSFPLLLTSAVKETGGFDEDLKSCQEYDLWIRLIERYSIAYTSEMLGVYYFSNDSTFKSSNKYMVGIESVIKKHEKLYLQYPRQYSNRLNNMAFELLRKREFLKSLQYKRRAFCIDKTNPNNLTVVCLIKRISRKKKK